jgi:3-oxoacyl-[acyl-carrier protein] reductase
LKNILITGTTRGVGFDLAQYYIEKGHQVIGMARSEATIQHPKYIHLIADISDESAVIAAMALLRKEVKSVDVLINNAAVANMNHLVTTPFETFQKISAINYGGTFLMMREVSKMMIRQKQGRIINFSSISNPLNLETQAAYASSKAAVESLTRIAARELGSFGITVNTITPTPLDHGLIKGIPEEWLNQVLTMQAIKRRGSVKDITHVIDFLIAPEADFITGQNIALGGVNV